MANQHADDLPGLGAFGVNTGLLATDPGTPRQLRRGSGQQVVDYIQPLIDAVGLTVVSIKIASYNAQPNQIIPVNSAAGSFPVNLPTNPSYGRRIKVFDVSGMTAVNPVSVVPAAGDTVLGNSLGVALDDGTSLSLMYDPATHNWYEDEPNALVGTPDIVSYINSGTADAALAAATGRTAGLAALTAGLLSPATAGMWRGGLTGEVVRSLLDHLADGAISVKSFGAKGDGTTDDTVNCQKAVDYCRTNRKPCHFPAGRYKLTTLILTPAQVATASSVTIFGDGCGYDSNSVNPTRGETVLDFSTVTAQAALLISSARQVVIRDMAIYGANLAPTTTGQYGALTDVESAWITGGFRDSRYSPQCAILVDGFASPTPPDGGYAGRTYNDNYFLSTHFSTCRVLIRGFVAGIVDTPGSSGNSRAGDTFIMEETHVYFCKEGFVSGQNQTRGCFYTRGSMGGCRTYFNGSSYGLGQGQVPVVSNSEFGIGNLLVRASSQYGHLDFTNCYLEGTASLGYFWAASGGQYHARFDGCYFKRAYVPCPPLIFESSAPVYFNGLMADLSPPSIAALNQSASNVYNVVGKPFMFHCGVVACSNSDKAVLGQQLTVTDGFRMGDIYAYGGGAASEDLSGNTRYAEVVRLSPSPLGRLRFQRGTYGALHGTTGARYDIAYGNTSWDEVNIVFSGLTGAGTATMTFVDTNGLLLNGDELFWQFKGFLPIAGGSQNNWVMPAYKVTAGATGTAGQTVTATALFDTSYYDTSYNAVAAAVREWAPAQALTGDIASGSAVISNVSPTTILKNNDWIKGATAGIQSTARVLSGGGTATVTMTRTATATVVGNVLYFARLMTPAAGTAAF
jgi:hypothetical protein